jgi:hypothetical protein
LSQPLNSTIHGGELLATPGRCLFVFSGEGRVASEATAFPEPSPESLRAKHEPLLATPRNRKFQADSGSAGVTSNAPPAPNNQRSGAPVMQINLRPPRKSGRDENCGRGRSFLQSRCPQERIFIPKILPLLHTNARLLSILKNRLGQECSRFTAKAPAL